MAICKYRNCEVPSERYNTYCKQCYKDYTVMKQILKEIPDFKNSYYSSELQGHLENVWKVNKHKFWAMINSLNPQNSFEETEKSVNILYDFLTG